MPVASYTVERYRSFVRRTTVELRPLTLLFGYNSAGKSALLRALPLLAASSGGAGLGPLALDAEVARGATYSEIRSRSTKRNELLLAAAWDDDHHAIREVEVRIRAVDEKRHVLTGITARLASGEEALRAIDVPEEPGSYTLTAPGQPPHVGPLALDGIRPLPRPGTVPDAFYAPLEAVASRLASLQSAVHWLGAVRSSPERRTSYRGVPARLGATGARAADRLAYDHQGPKKLFPSVSTSVREMFGHSLEVRDEGAEYALELIPVEGSPIRVSIVDAGEGVTQVLPVLVLGAMAQAGELGEGAVLAMEQPEMHLHPRAEQALAKFLCTVSRATSRPRLLIETHSENLLLFVQLEVARGAIAADDVAILWVEVHEDGESDVRQVSLDAQGRPSGWPPGVFSEDVEIARELFLARRNPRP